MAVRAAPLGSPRCTRGLRGCEAGVPWHEFEVEAEAEGPWEGELRVTWLLGRGPVGVPREGLRREVRGPVLCGEESDSDMAEGLWLRPCLAVGSCFPSVSGTSPVSGCGFLLGFLLPSCLWCWGASFSGPGPGLLVLFLPC